MLTGPPRLGGVLQDYVSADGPMECAWDDSESRWRNYAGGARELVLLRERLVGRFTIDGWSEADAEALLEIVREPFLVCPRTWQAGDPGSDADEIDVMCRRTNPRAATSPIYRTNNANGRPVWRFDVEFEAVTTVDGAGVPGGGGSACIFPDIPQNLEFTVIDGDLWAKWDEVTTPAGAADGYTVFFGTADGVYTEEDVVAASEVDFEDEWLVNLGPAEDEVTYYGVATAYYENAEATT